MVGVDAGDSVVDGLFVVIGQPTVLVFGAGVSCEYDFPLARPLLQHVVQEFKESSPLRFDMTKCGFEQDLMRQFASELAASYQPSIDSFLEQHKKNTDYERLGKAAIAAELIRSEAFSTLADRSAVKAYEAIWHQARATPGTYGGNRLSVLTFNYDRSFEQFLGSCLANSHPEFRDRGERFRQALGQFEVFHMYGALGSLDERHPENYLVFGGHDHPAHPDTILAAARRIKLPYQARYDRNEPFSFERLSNLISEAEVIAFLGFAFDPLNVKILKFCGVGDVSQAAYYSSSYKLNKGVQEAAQEVLGCEIQFAGPNAKCVDVLGEFPILVAK